METNLGREVEKLDARWKELDTLFEIALSFDPEDTKSEYLCRAISVLICAHFEGSIKALSYALIKDLNEDARFHTFPDEIKMSYVREKLYVENPSNDVQIREMAKVLGEGGFRPKDEDLTCLFDHNSHINGEVIEKWSKLFGTRNFFSYIAYSELENVFEGSYADGENLLNRLTKDCKTGLKANPYDLEFIENYGLFVHHEEIHKESMYASFLEDTFQRRHGIAHGNDLSNQSGIKQLKIDVIKMRLLLLAYAVIAGAALRRRLERNDRIL